MRRTCWRWRPDSASSWGWTTARSTPLRRSRWFDRSRTRPPWCRTSWASTGPPSTPTSVCSGRSILRCACHPISVTRSRGRRGADAVGGRSPLTGSGEALPCPAARQRPSHLHGRAGPVVESVRRVHTAIRERARLSVRAAWRVQECLMLERLPLGAVIALSFISAPATAAQPPLGLQDLLSIGVDAPSEGLKWGASRRKIQQRYPELVEHPAFLGFRLQGRLSAQGCTYTAYLSGNRKSDRLEQIWIVHRTGPLAQCRSQLESALAALYG